MISLFLQNMLLLAGLKPTNGFVNQAKTLLNS